MGLTEVAAGVALAGVVAYGVLAGADFGGGVWDAFARGPRSAAQREAIAHAMGPVWEANHVWLIFAIVVLFTAFPTGYAALGVALFAPFHLALVGITLRGAAFVFRAYGPQSDAGRARWGRVFGASSVITPVLLGMCVGAVSSGAIRVRGGVVSTPEGVPWLAPIALAMGALALALCAYLAAVFLTLETSGELREDFRKRAIWAGTFVVGGSAFALPLTYARARHLWEGLTSAHAAPVVAAGVVAALVSGWALWRRRYRVARMASVVQVALVLVGWGIAQHPYLIYPDVTLAGSAAPRATLLWLVYVLVPGAALLAPSMWLLFRVFKGKGGKGQGSGAGAV